MTEKRTALQALIEERDALREQVLKYQDAAMSSQIELLKEHFSGVVRDEDRKMYMRALSEFGAEVAEERDAYKQTLIVMSMMAGDYSEFNELADAVLGKFQPKKPEAGE